MCMNIKVGSELRTICRHVYSFIFYCSLSSMYGDVSCIASIYNVVLVTCFSCNHIYFV